MQEEGLSPDDAQLILVFILERDEVVAVKPLPRPGETAKFFAYFDGLKDEAVHFLGVLGLLKDREAEKILSFILPFTSEARDNKILEAAVREAALKSGKPQLN